MISGFNHFDDNIKTFQLGDFTDSIIYNSNMTVTEFNLFFENGKCLEYRFDVYTELLKFKGTVILNPLNNPQGQKMLGGNIVGNSMIILTVQGNQVTGFGVFA